MDHDSQDILVQNGLAVFLALLNRLLQPHNAALVRLWSLQKSAIPPNGKGNAILRRPVELYWMLARPRSNHADHVFAYPQRRK
jgi:hypothetical protein